MRIKICGITQPEQGQAIAQMGATALGFICVESSPRYLTTSQIRHIIDALPFAPQTSQPSIARVGVFVDATVDHIVEVVKAGNLSAVQLHGQETVEFCSALQQALKEAEAATATPIRIADAAQPSAQTAERSEAPSRASTLRTSPPRTSIELIKAFRVRSPETLDLAYRYSPVVETLLLDAYHPTMLGGTGKTLNWKALQSFQPDCPWLLAGGLTPDNIGEALAQLQPSGIDLSSGVERSPGDKDLAKVRRLFEQIRQL